MEQITNEKRADLGHNAVRHATIPTGVWANDDRDSATIDALSYIAHYCVRRGNDPYEVFDAALSAFDADTDDGKSVKLDLTGED